MLPYDDANGFFDSATSYGSSSYDAFSLAPSTPMSRSPTNRPIDMVRIDSSRGLSFSTTSDDCNDFGIIGGEMFQFDEFIADPIVLSGTDEPYPMLPPNPPLTKRKAEDWPSHDHHHHHRKKMARSLAPAAAHSSSYTTTTVTTSSHKRGSSNYVRPKHPRVKCAECPEGHKGFRGDHEYRRHHDRVHAVKKKAWVVRDRSGTGMLGKCKACSSERMYGVDYNATAHLKRQHFNPDKNPGVRVPDNIRDWIEAIDVPGGRVRGRGKGKNAGVKTCKQQEHSDEEEMVDTDDEDEDQGDELVPGRFEVSITQQGFGKQQGHTGEVSHMTYESYVQQQHQQRQLKVAEKHTQEALLHDAPQLSINYASWGRHDYRAPSAIDIQGVTEIRRGHEPKYSTSVQTISSNGSFFLAQGVQLEDANQLVYDSQPFGSYGMEDESGLFFSRPYDT